MGERIFIPLTDELLYDHPERITGPLMPYSAERPCHHWLAVELNPVDVPAQARPEAPEAEGHEAPRAQARRRTPRPHALSGQRAAPSPRVLSGTG